MRVLLRGLIATMLACAAVSFTATQAGAQSTQQQQQTCYYCTGTPWGEAYCTWTTGSGPAYTGCYGLPENTCAFWGYQCFLARNDPSFLPDGTLPSGRLAPVFADWQSGWSLPIWNTGADGAIRDCGGWVIGRHLDPFRARQIRGHLRSISI